MRKTTSGFTIVELLIVIVVIAILAAISIVAYSGIQERAKVTQQVGAVEQYVKAFSLYTVEKGTYPYTGTSYSNSIACVNPYPDCGDAEQSAALGASLRNNLQPYLGTQPSFNAKVAVNYSIFTGYTGTYFYVIFNANLSSCPNIGGLTFLTMTAGNPLACRYRPTTTP